jgi:hypothetical protein
LYFSKELPVNPVVIAHLRDYPFNPAHKKRGLSDEEFRKKHGEEVWKGMMSQRVVYKRKRGMKLVPAEEAFIQKYPGLIDDVS